MNLTPEYLASLRSGAEHMRHYNLVLQDVRGEVTLALLDRIEALEKLAKPLLEADLAPNEPYWPPDEDVTHDGEWCPVPGAAIRALWELSRKP